MIALRVLPTIFLVTVLLAAEARAGCNIADSKIEEAILQKPEFRDPANRQMVRDLRSLRDSAFVLWSYGRMEDCERLMGNIRELVASPAMGNLGGSDEDEVEDQEAAREPLVRRGGATLGRRADPNASPLIRIDEMAPGLRADEIIGAEVRTSDDKIVGEVRNIVFGTKDENNQPIPPGKVGAKLLVTTLTNRTLPLVRYELTDIVAWSEEPCQCGRPFARLAAIDGRREEVLRFAKRGGSTVDVHAIRLRSPLIGAEGVRQFQLAQGENELFVSISLHSGQDSERVTRNVQAAMRDLLEAIGVADVLVTINVVDTIERVGSGAKMKLVIQK